MEIIYDRTNFPLIKIDPLNIFVHVLPVTKIQFERFLSDHYASPDSQGYTSSIIDLNPRISPRNFNADEAWKIFATALLPDEIARFTSWLGPSYRLPTRQEWITTKEWLENINADVFQNAILELNGMNILANILIQKIFEVYSAKNALDVCMQLNTIMEWTKDTLDSKQLALIGAPDRRLFSSLERTDYLSPMYPINYNKRIAYAGFRLIKV